MSQQLHLYEFIFINNNILGLFFKDCLYSENIYTMAVKAVTSGLVTILAHINTENMLVIHIADDSEQLINDISFVTRMV